MIRDCCIVDLAAAVGVRRIDLVERDRDAESRMDWKLLATEVMPQIVQCVYYSPIQVSAQLSCEVLVLWWTRPFSDMIRFHDETEIIASLYIAPIAESSLFTSRTQQQLATIVPVSHLALDTRPCRLAVPFPYNMPIPGFCTA